MEVPGSPNAVLQQVNQLWSMLDDMSVNSPEGYRKFIEKQMREGADYCSPPQPDSCIRVGILGPKPGVLYINVCCWKRVPAPSSPEQPVPVCGGRLETLTEGKEQYSVLDVAYSPAVLERARGDPQEREQLHLLAMSYVVQQHSLSLNSHRYKMHSNQLKGSLESMRDRLTQKQAKQAPSPPPQPPQADTVPSLLQQISSLRGKGGAGGDDDDPSAGGGVTLELGGHQKPPAKPGLIQVISSSESRRVPQRPAHRLTLKPGTGGASGGGPLKSLELSVELPGVRSVTECQLSISQDDILLEVEDMYHLHVDLPETVNEETATATFSKRTHTLTLTVAVL
ncbi:PIH1 domain-containing protein 2 [Engraulis encrasicolus]|uniref:PIH1 domain-containing protein 2 n=1 Tax=Engraulis encrasicolus TaxID=184585 RepID=UPI002FD74038